MLNEMMPEGMPPAGRRFDPLRQMQRAQADLNRLFGGLRFYPATEFPSLNLWTSPDGAIVAAEVPGVASEELDITIQRDTVTVRGNRPPEPVDDRTVVQRQERPHGPFARTIVLPFRVDADKASARLRFSRAAIRMLIRLRRASRRDWSAWSIARSSLCRLTSGLLSNWRAAASRSAASHTTSGLFPPISRATIFPG